MKAIVAILCLYAVSGCVLCDKLEVVKDDSSNNFIAGIIQGLQADYTTPSLCVRNIESVQPNFANFAQEIETLFSTLNVSRIFYVLDQFENLTKNLEDVVTRCNLTTLTNTILSLQTESGRITVQSRITSNLPSLTAQFMQFNTYLQNQKYTEAGRIIGQVLKLALNYTL